MISRTAFNCIALASKVEPLSVMQALTQGLDSKNNRVRSQCLRGLNLLTDYVDTRVLEKVVALIEDPRLSNTALLAARRLISSSEQLKSATNEQMLSTIEQGSFPRRNSPQTVLDAAVAN